MIGNLRLVLGNKIFHHRIIRRGKFVLEDLHRTSMILHKAFVQGQCLLHTGILYNRNYVILCM